MRIAMIGPFGLELKSTVRRRALPLARALAACGDEVLVTMPPWHTPAAVPGRWPEDGVTLEYVPLGPAVPLLQHGVIAARLVGHALDWQPDVIHCFKPKAHAGMAGWLLWHLRRVGLARPRLVIDEDDWEGPGGWNDREPYPPAARALSITAYTPSTKASSSRWAWESIINAYFTLLPAGTGPSGVTTLTSLGSPVVDAASSIPFDMTPRSFAGFRLVTTTICLPMSSSGE